MVVLNKAIMLRPQAGWTIFPWLDFVLYATQAQNRSTPNLPHMAAFIDMRQHLEGYT
jgi:hypothetical protein